MLTQNCLPLGTRTLRTMWKVTQKRTLPGSRAEALCLLTETVLFALFWDTTCLPKGAKTFKNPITMRQKKGDGENVYLCLISTFLCKNCLVINWGLFFVVVVWADLLEKQPQSQLHITPLTATEHSKGEVNLVDFSILRALLSLLEKTTELESCCKSH